MVVVTLPCVPLGRVMEVVRALVSVGADKDKARDGSGATP